MNKMKMFKWFMCMLLGVAGLQATAQNQTAYWVFLTDKGGSAEEQMQVDLSERSLQRRIHQGIPLTESDRPVSDLYLQTLSDMGYTIRVASRWMNAVSLEAASSDLATLATLPFVKHIQPVQTYTMEKEVGFPEQNAKFRKSGESNVPEYGSANNQNTMISMEFLHEKGFRGQGMLIAVLDGGFLGVDEGPGFSSFWEKEQIEGWWNFADNNDSVFFSTLHGSNVLSIMGADIPGVYVGSAPDASYFLLRTEVVLTEQVVEEDHWLAAAEYADFIGADIINSSLGYTTFDEESENHSYADMDGNTTIVTKAADMAASKGILVCNSAGNSANDTWHYIGAPADGDSVFTIGAVDENRQYASFSSTGPSFDGRIKPNIAVQGQNTAYVDASGIVYIGNGTSYSSPLSAGAVACLWQAFPEKTNWDIMQAVQQSASQVNAPDSLLGYGIPNMAIAYYLLEGIPFNEPGTGNISIFPNPINQNSLFVIHRPIGNGERVLVTDMLGRVVIDQELYYAEGPMHLVSISGLDKLQRGNYLLALVKDDIEESQILETISFVVQ